MAIDYAGFYARFEAPTKKLAGILTGADTLVGDEFEVYIKVEDGVSLAWIKNRFGAEIGFFDADTTRKIQLALARDMHVHALLSFVAYSEAPDPGLFWGEFAIVCFKDSDAEVFQPFLSNVAAKLCEGVRTDIDLGHQDIEQLRQNPNWLPQGTIFLPETSRGSAIIKSKRTLSEKVVEQGRNRNIGCYIGTFAIFAIVIAFIVFSLHSCGVF